jgi:hypothetical protein
MATTEDDTYMYYNYLSERWNTVDYTYLTVALNSKLSASLANAIMSSTGTMGGIMFTMDNPAPSYLSILTCMSILNIESMSVIYKSNFDSYHRAIIETDSDLYPDINFLYNNPYDYYFRKINLSDTEEHSSQYVIEK